MEKDEKFQSLAEFLGVQDPRPEAEHPPSDFNALLDVSDPVDFCRRVLQSREFRQYIMNGIVLGDLPTAIVGRVMDHAWGKPPERIEHTGKDGAPIITEIRRVIIRALGQEELEEQPAEEQPAVTH